MVYYNQQAQAGSDFGFVKSLCRFKNTSALPEAVIETISACGENKTLPVYRIIAEDFERAIDGLLLRSKSIHRFALFLSEGHARVKKDLKIQHSSVDVLNSSVELDIVIAGQLPAGWTKMTQPPTAAQLTTHIDLAQHAVFISSGGAETRVCLQVHLSSIDFAHVITKKSDLLYMFRTCTSTMARCFTQSSFYLMHYTQRNFDK